MMIMNLCSQESRTKKQNNTILFKEKFQKYYNTVKKSKRNNIQYKLSTRIQKKKNFET